MKAFNQKDTKENEEDGYREDFVRYSRKFQHIVKVDEICIASCDEFPKIPSIIGLFLRNKRTRIDMYLPLQDPELIGKLIIDLQIVKEELEKIEKNV